ncbi:ROK family protein [Atopobacter phocae]|uniref:ROK family protein n=1 Tax=Atopobacter phocae TaxID=136492 RepID=UPI000472AE37|nr:ROK family protein [Atopobacter phocae]
MHILAIDIGGTTIKTDIYNQDGHSMDCFGEIPTPINMDEGSNQILETVLELVGDSIAFLSNQNKTLTGIAISSAGVVDPIQGKIIYAGYTIPGYIGTDFKAAIEAAYHLPCTILNDVNAAAYGEFQKGDFSADSTVACLTIGTGIGGAVIVNGALHHGHHFSAGEVGYLPINGQRFQDIASTTAMCKYYESLTGKEEVNGKIIFEAYQANDHAAIETIEWFTKNFAEGLLPIIYLLNPDSIILGGGIMHQHVILLPMIEKQLQSVIENESFLPKEIMPAQFGNEAGRLGAYYYFLSQQ